MSTRSTLRRAAALIAGVVIGSTLLIPGAEAMAPRDAQSAPKSAGLPAITRQAGTRCFGQTDNPHNSRHFPGDVSVSSRTVCPGHAVTVVVWLYKRVHGSWRLLDTGRNAGAGRTQANAHGRCGRRGTTHRFLGIGYHTATGHAAAATRNAKRVTCR